jgi:hypothetical protein
MVQISAYCWLFLILILHFILKKPKHSLKQVLLVQQPEFEFRDFHPQVKVDVAVSTLFNVVVIFLEWEISDHGLLQRNPVSNSCIWAWKRKAVCVYRFTFAIVIHTTRKSVRSYWEDWTVYNFSGVRCQLFRPKNMVRAQESDVSKTRNNFAINLRIFLAAGNQ